MELMTLQFENLDRQLQKIMESSSDIVDLLEQVDYILEDASLNEAEYNKVVDHLKLEILDVDRFIKVNECQRVTNPVFFVRNNIPSDDGLMSYKIFGITMEDRAGIFAYIDLNGWFMDPSCYKTWKSIDSTVKDVIHGMDTYEVDKNGNIVPSASGGKGVKFLMDNIDKIKFKNTDSEKRTAKIKYLEKNKNRMFINKYIVIPPFYRDTNSGRGNTVGVSGVNTLYRNLILASNGLETTQDYGFDQTDALNGRIQETLLEIYDWFAGNSNPVLKNTGIESGLGLASKRGIIHSANMSKTTNYSSRTVIVSAELKAESVDDMKVKFDQTAIPLAVCLANYRPYMQFQVRRFFENQFMGKELVPVIGKDGKVEYVRPKDPLIEFSDERIKKEMDRFLHGYNNRLIPIELPIENQDPKTVYYLQFKGSNKKIEEGMESPEPIYHRRLTWCDVFYQCAVEVARGKNVLITRYPIDSYFNQITTKVVVSSTKDTEPMYIENTYYPYYPKIRDEMIGTNTGNMFIDTTMLSNLYLEGMGGDYDGDTVTVKSPYTIESNDELDEFSKSKANYIDLGGNNIRLVGKDVINSAFALTRILSSCKPLTDPVFA